MSNDKENYCSYQGWGRYYFKIENAIEEIELFLRENKQLPKDEPVEWIPYSVNDEGDVEELPAVTDLTIVVLMVKLGKMETDKLFNELTGKNHAKQSSYFEET